MFRLLEQFICKRARLNLLWAGSVAVCASMLWPVLNSAQELVLQDPMRPKQSTVDAAAASAAPRIKLDGVLNSSERKVAVINGRLYREGSRVRSSTVESIDAASVVLRRGDELIVLYVEEPRRDARQATGDSPK